MKNILLTFDLEEFNLPREFGQKISEKQMFEISKEGLINILKILEKYKIQATFFTTAVFAKRYSKIIKDISKTHEIASHGYDHSGIINLESLKKAKKEKEKIIQKKIKGFRSPRWNIKKIENVYFAGFDYDSSTHPIFLPGRYSNLKQKRKIHRIKGLVEIPMSTLPPNFSIFWLAFKNFPLKYSQIFTKINFIFSDYTMLVMHPWEFTNIKKFKIPFYIKRNHKNLIKKLEEYIIFCKKNKYEFFTIKDFLKN